MGIVVTLFMGLGLLKLKPLFYLQFNQFGKNLKNNNWVGSILFLTGAWNTFWHGLRFLDSFWGLAALISGIFMMMASLLILSKSPSFDRYNRKISSVIKLFQSLEIVISIALLICFGLYFMTLVQLNLGFTIIQ